MLTIIIFHKLVNSKIWLNGCGQHNMYGYSTDTVTNLPLRKRFRASESMYTFQVSLLNYI